MYLLQIVFFKHDDNSVSCPSHSSRTGVSRLFPWRDSQWVPKLCGSCGACRDLATLLLRCRPSRTQHRKVWAGHVCGPQNPCLHHQVAGQVWPTGHSFPTPVWESGLQGTHFENLSNGIDLFSQCLEISLVSWKVKRKTWIRWPWLMFQL